MGCCKNRISCCQNSSNMTISDQHVESMTGAGFEILVQLIDVARSGVAGSLQQLLTQTVFKNEQVKTLADTVVALVLENEYLKKVAKPFIPEVTATNRVFELSFGPKNSYKLCLTFDSANDADTFANQLRQAADNLTETAKSSDQLQQTFFKF